MIKQFFRDTGIYGISNLISRGVSIFLVPFYTRVLTPSDYGIIDIIAIFSSIVAITVPLEISQAVARFLADKIGDNTEDEGNTILVSSVGLFFTIVVFSVFVVTGLAASGFLSRFILDDSSKQNILIAAIINIFFTGLFYFFQNQLKWTLKSKKYAMVSIVYTVVNIGLTIIFILILKTGVIGIFYAYIISSGLAALLGYWFSRKNYSFVFSKNKLTEMLRFSLPLVPSSVGVFFINYAQRIIIKGIMSLSDLGLFGIGTRISSVINLGFQSVQGAIVPLTYQNASEKSTPENLSKIFSYLSFVLLLFFITISMFASDIMVILTSPSYYSAGSLIPFLVLSEGFGGLQRSFSSGMTLKKRSDLVAYINISGSIFALAISFLFIYLLGLLGAAIAITIQSVTMFVVQMSFSQKFYFVPYEFIRILAALACSVVLIVICLFIPIKYGILLTIIFKLILILAYGLSLIYLFRLISHDELKKIYSKIRGEKK